jgi:hypothetical protein
MRSIKPPSKRGQLPNLESSYLANVSARVVRTFQGYAQNIEPDDKSFLAYVANYLAERHVEDPRLLPYSQLYKLVKSAIHEYLRIKDQDRPSRK